MTFLLLQAFLLMAASYFLGAFLGCWWRRAFYQESEVAPARVAEAAMAGAAGAAVPAAVTARTEPIRTQPRIEYSSTPDGAGDATRFGRALSGVGTMAEPTPRPVKPAHVGVVTPPPAPAKPVAAAPPAASAPVAATPAKIEVKPAPPPAASPEIAEAPAAEASATALPDAERKTDSAVSAAAAAAAAAMAVAATRRSAEEPVKQVPPAPARPQVASAGGSGVAADVRTPPLVPADRQDLKLIRGIEEVTERTLHSQGIWRYNDIARWTAKDVAAANRVLSTKGRVERENWIEQAAMLAGGGLTDYARRRLRGEHAAAKPSAVATPPRSAAPTTLASAVPLVAGKTPVASSPSAAASAAAAAVAAAAAAASRGVASSERRPMPAPHQPPPQIVAAPVVAPPVVAPPAAASSLVEAAKPQPVPPAASPAPEVSTASTTAAPEANAPAAPAQASADLLQRIRGIDGSIERLLIAEGVRHYRQIAGWTSSDVARFDALLVQPGRIGRENWIEQAQILAGGVQTQFARQHDAEVASPAQAEAGGLRPARLSDAIRDQQDRGAKPARTDVSGLRSVRSEALRPAQADAQRIGGAAARPSSPDDLKRIRGIGVLIEKKLNSLGVASYDQIANWTADDIAHVSDVLDFRGRIERENWVEQARILSAGGQTEFSRRVDRGEIQ